MTDELAALQLAMAGGIAAELAQLNESIARSESSAATVMLDHSSVGRLSRMDAMQQQAMAREIGARLVVRKRALEAALARVDAGTFGRCCECEADIGVERLEADLAAVFCSACMRERDAGKGGRRAQ